MVMKPSKQEQEFFVRQEAERLKRLHQEHLSKMAEKQRQEMKALHYLHCAKCGQKMETTQMAEVEIEICPDCGGIYLDAGELPKIIGEQTRKPFADALGLFRRLWSE